MSSITKEMFDDFTKTSEEEKGDLMDVLGEFFGGNGTYGDRLHDFKLLGEVATEFFHTSDYRTLSKELKLTSLIIIDLPMQVSHMWQLLTCTMVLVMIQSILDCLMMGS